MRIILTLSLMVTLIVGLSYADGWGQLRYVHTSVNVRADRSTDSEILLKLNRGDSVKVDYLKNNWYAVFAVSEIERSQKNAIGFVYAPLLKPTPHEQTVAKQRKQGNHNIEYNIVERKDYSYSNVKRMSFRIILDVDQIPEDDQIKSIANTIHDNGNKNWDEFIIFIYLPGLDTQSLAYAVAEYKGQRLVDFNINSTALWDTKWQNKK